MEIDGLKTTLKKCKGLEKIKELWLHCETDELIALFAYCLSSAVNNTSLYFVVSFTLLVIN